MYKFMRVFISLLSICSLLAGCSNQPATVQEETTQATTAATEATETVAVVPETIVETEAVPSAEETACEEEEYVPSDINDPVLLPPAVSEEPCSFYDDAAFIGDSISYTLFLHNSKTQDLGKARFLVRGSLGIHNTLNGQLKIYYQGKEMTPWDAVAACGAKKVFIMLGMNDIGYYGIDGTMEKWDIFLEKIREKSPDVEIYIQSQTPMWTDANLDLLNNDNIDLYNQELKEFAEESGCSFVNIAPYFKDSTNGLAQKYCNDKYVHMNFEGTTTWVKVLKAYAEELEGK